MTVQTPLFVLGTSQLQLAGDFVDDYYVINKVSGKLEL